MTRKLNLLALTILLGPASTIHAQYAGVPGGIGFQYGGRGLKVGGIIYGGPGAYVPVGPGGVILGPPIYVGPPYAVMRMAFITGIPFLSDRSSIGAKRGPSGDGQGSALVGAGWHALVEQVGVSW